MSSWLKKIAAALVLLGFLTVMLPLAWSLLQPALPVLFLTAAAIVILVRLFKKSGGEW